jgi:signal transduction histidine kinase/ActR/RegA family two-component response regulator
MNEALPAHLHALLDVLDEPALLIRPDGHVLGVNGAMARQLQLKPKEIVGRRLADLLAAPKEKIATYLRRASGSRQSTMGALVFLRQNGSEFGARCYCNLVDTGSDRGTAILSLRCRPRAEVFSPFQELNRRLDELTKEIIRRQQAEARLHQLNLELEERVRREVSVRVETQGRLAQAQRLEALGQLAAGIAHDFNNVLQGVSGALALIYKRSASIPTVQQLARMGLDVAERGASITARLLAFARHGEIHAEAVDAGQLLESLREILVPTLGPAITIEIDVAEQTPAVLVDKGQIETVLVNLAINARDAMPEGGTLTIAAAAEHVGDGTTHPGHIASGDYVRVAVSDTGIGMDSATLARAAEPFFTTKPVGTGTGLGLAMARGFATQSGGGFLIDSAPGRGTTIVLWFPQAVKTALSSSVLTDNDALSPLSNNSRVMVVDDDSVVREILVQHLKDCGYQIIQASDGLSASAWLDENEPLDLLITDYAMPGMNGLNLIREMRQRRPTVPAMLLTGYADASLQLSIADVNGGKTILLRKPVRGDELAEQAAKLLTSQPRLAAPMSDTNEA